MEKPAQCSTELYLLMRDCWHFYPNQRPTFTELVEDLQRILKISCEEEYLDLGLPALDTPPSSDETGAIEQSATKFFQLQNQPLQFHNHHYDPDTNWSPDQGFGSASGSGFCPSEGLCDDFPLTYTTLTNTMTSSPGTSTPIRDYKNTLTYSTQCSLPNGYLDTHQALDLPPPPPSFLQQTSLPLGDSYREGTTYTYCNFAEPPSLPSSLYQKYPGVERDQLRIPRYIETQAGTHYGHILDRPSAKTESQCTEDVEEYGEGEQYQTLTLTNNTSL